MRRKKGGDKQTYTHIPKEGKRFYGGQRTKKGEKGFIRDTHPEKIMIDYDGFSYFITDDTFSEVSVVFIKLSTLDIFDVNFLFERI